MRANIENSFILIVIFVPPIKGLLLFIRNNPYENIF
tara:strand:+ start:600 stop:707 length:108 start_codon:yes stop_codon:yes gene_type:complete